MDDVIEPVEPQEEILEDENQEKVVEQPRKYKVKIDAEEMEVDEDELLKGYQLSKASHKRFQEASQQLKSIEEMFQLGKQDPTQILQALGVDPLEWINQFVESQLQEAQMTDEQKELRDLRRMREEQDKIRKQIEEEQQQEMRKQKQEAFAQQIDNDINAALAEAGVKPTPKIIARVAEQLLADLNSGKQLDARSALARTQNDIQAELADILSSDPSKVLSKADKKQLEALRKYFMSDVAAVEDESPQVEQASNKKQKRQSIDDMFGDLNLL